MSGKSLFTYKSDLPDEEIQKIKTWHNNRLKELKNRGAVSVNYLGRTIVVPPLVYPPRHTSHMLGEVVLAEVKETDRVLDMGTGSGINAILAASKSHNVVAVDVNPDAVECTRNNAKLNNVDPYIEARVSDVFENVEGRFDLIIFDPPFRWFQANDMLEKSIADENYTTLTSFFRDVSNYLTKDGKVLIFFGTSGDLNYLHRLIKKAGFNIEVLSKNTETTKDGFEMTQYTYKLTLS